MIIIDVLGSISYSKIHIFDTLAWQLHSRGTIA